MGQIGKRCLRQNTEVIQWRSNPRINRKPSRELQNRDDEFHILRNRCPESKAEASNRRFNTWCILPQMQEEAPPEGMSTWQGGSVLDL